MTFLDRRRFRCARPRRAAAFLRQLERRAARGYSLQAQQTTHGAANNEPPLPTTPNHTQPLPANRYQRTAALRPIGSVAPGRTAQTAKRETWDLVLTKFCVQIGVEQLYLIVD